MPQGALPSCWPADARVAQEDRKTERMRAKAGRTRPQWRPGLVDIMALVAEPEVRFRR